MIITEERQHRLFSYIVNETTEITELGDAYDIRFDVYQGSCLFLEVKIKWDGCINISPPHGLHFCSMEEVKEFNDMITELYNIAKKWFLTTNQAYNWREYL